jgi:hypothetical protein|tara:strand:- start:761 stop:889 length:129 start_codon:yes stop_codon:yes gene_type:complete
MNFLKTILNIKTYLRNNRSRYMELVLHAVLTGVIVGLVLIIF